MFYFVRIFENDERNIYAYVLNEFQCIYFRLTHILIHNGVDKIRNECHTILCGGTPVDGYSVGDNDYRRGV